jgi:hypothetical protein
LPGKPLISGWPIDRADASLPFEINATFAVKRGSFVELKVRITADATAPRKAASLVRFCFAKMHDALS